MKPKFPVNQPPSTGMRLVKRLLKTATGQWLFVSVNMADLYADMLQISGKGDKPLEVCGYVNEGVLPLLVFKAPANMALPSCEEGYFRQVE